MAQLHTINVTPDFVQKALSEQSSKFEISHDGRKVRWKGGRSLTRTSSEGDDTSPQSAGASAYGESSRKRIKTSHDRTNGLRNHRQHVAQKKLGYHQQDNRLSYTPLFFHHGNEDNSEESSSLMDETTPGSPDHTALGDTSSGMTSSGPRPVLKNGNRSGDGAPIIFYNNARFCTDLSGDHGASENMIDSATYNIPPFQPVGVRPESFSSDLFGPRGPLYEANDLPEAMNLCDDPNLAGMGVNFPPQTPMTVGSEKSPLDFEACGLGGVYPADNFSINVRTQHTRIAKADRSEIQTKGLGRVYCDRISNVLTRSNTTREARPQLHRVISTRRRDLPPSKLPPAACFMDFDESEDDSDVESDSIMDAKLSALPPPSTALQLITLPCWSEESDAGDDEDYDDESDSDGSVDLLATARKADPEAIRAREREYDAATAERLAEEIPAGSSAATAGGGSGFASPESGLDAAEFEEAVRVRNKVQQASGMARPQLKRSRSSDSMVVNGDSF